MNLNLFPEALEVRTVCHYIPLTHTHTHTYVAEPNVVIYYYFCFFLWWLDSGSSDIETPDSTHSVSGSPTEQLSPRAARMDSPDAVDPQVITIVADVGRDRWREIGRQLQFTEYELLEYERIEGLQEKLYRILNDWTRGHTHATTEQLLDVCDEVRIGGLVRREIQARI
jgi:hypothetical protein